MDVEITEVETEPIQEGKLVYESDLRAAAHRNGRVDDLVGSPEVGGDGPGLPDEPEWPGGHKPDRQPRSMFMSLAIATAYLGFGGLMVYAGILVLKDVWTDRKKEKS